MVAICVLLPAEGAENAILFTHILATWERYFAEPSSLARARARRLVVKCDDGVAFNSTLSLLFFIRPPSALSLPPEDEL